MDQITSLTVSSAPASTKPSVLINGTRFDANSLIRAIQSAMQTRQTATYSEELPALEIEKTS